MSILHSFCGKKSWDIAKLESCQPSAMELFGTSQLPIFSSSFRIQSVVCLSIDPIGRIRYSRCKSVNRELCKVTKHPCFSIMMLLPILPAQVLTLPYETMVLQAIIVVSFAKKQWLLLVIMPGLDKEWISMYILIRIGNFSAFNNWHSSMPSLYQD